MKQNCVPLCAALYEDLQIFYEDNFDHPPPILAKNMLPKYAVKWGVVWRKNPLK